MQSASNISSTIRSFFVSSILTIFSATSAYAATLVLSDLPPPTDNDQSTLLTLYAPRPVDLSLIAAQQFRRINVNQLVDDAVSDVTFRAYCQKTRTPCKRLNWTEFSSFANNYQIRTSSAARYYPIPVRASLLAGTELFESVNNNNDWFEINTRLAYNIELLQAATRAGGNQITSAIEQKAFSTHSNTATNYPKTFNVLAYETGQVSIGKPRITSLSSLKEEYGASDNVRIPSWLSQQSNFYFLEVPFTIHPLIETGYEYENLTIRIVLNNAEHTAFELYPITVLEDSEPVKVDVALEPKLRKGDLIIELGKIFNVRFFYKNLHPIIRSYGLGESTFYWKFEQAAIEMEGTRRIFAIIEVPKGHTKLSGNVSLQARLDTAVALEKLMQFFENAKRNIIGRGETPSSDSWLLANPEYVRSVWPETALSTTRPLKWALELPKPTK